MVDTYCFGLYLYLCEIHREYYQLTVKLVYVIFTSAISIETEL